MSKPLKRIKKAVKKWAKKKPDTLDFHTHIFANGKRYVISIVREDWNKYSDVNGGC